MNIYVCDEECVIELFNTKKEALRFARQDANRCNEKRYVGDYLNRFDVVPVSPIKHMVFRFFANPDNYTLR